MKQVYPTLLAVVVSTFCLVGCQQKQEPEPSDSPIELEYNDLSSLYKGKRVAVRGYLRLQSSTEERLENGHIFSEILLRPQSYDKEIRMKEDPSASAHSFKILLKVKVGDGRNEMASPEMVAPLVYSPRSLRFHTASKDVGTEDLVQVIGILRDVEYSGITKTTESHIEVETIELATKPSAASNTNVSTKPVAPLKTNKNERGSQ